MSWLRYYLISAAAAAASKLLQSCLALCDPIDGSPPGFPVAGILQARTLEWVAISFSNAWKWKVKVKLLSHVWLSNPMTAAYQAPLSVGFSRQGYWNRLPLPSPFDLYSSLNLTVLFSLLCAQLLFRVQPFMVLWTVVHQGPLSLQFFRQEYWSGLPFPSPRDLPDRPMDQIFVFCVSCICRQILYSWAIWAHYHSQANSILFSLF